MHDSRSPVRISASSGWKSSSSQIRDSQRVRKCSCSGGVSCHSKHARCGVSERCASECRAGQSGYIPDCRRGGGLSCHHAIKERKWAAKHGSSTRLSGEDGEGGGGSTFCSTSVTGLTESSLSEFSVLLTPALARSPPYRSSSSCDPPAARHWSARRWPPVATAAWFNPATMTPLHAARKLPLEWRGTHPSQAPPRSQSREEKHLRGAHQLKDGVPGDVGKSRKLCESARDEDAGKVGAVRERGVLEEVLVTVEHEQSSGVLGVQQRVAVLSHGVPAVSTSVRQSRGLVHARRLSHAVGLLARTDTHFSDPVGTRTRTPTPTHTAVPWTRPHRPKKHGRTHVIVRFITASWVILAIANSGSRLGTTLIQSKKAMEISSSSASCFAVSSASIFAISYSTVGSILL